MVGAQPSGRGLLAALKPLLRPHTLVAVLHPSYAPAARELFDPEEQDRVLEFPKLASRFRAQIEDATEIFTLSQRQLVLLVGQAVSQEASRTDAWAASAGLPGVHRAVASALSELRLHQTDPDDWEAWAAQATETLAPKLSLLSAVERALDARLAEKTRCVPSQVFADCLGRKVSHLLGQFSHFVVVAGSEPEPLILEWCRWAASQGAEVDLLIESCSRLTALSLPDCPPSWTDSLFAGAVRVPLPQIEVHSAADPLSEAEWVLRRCQDWMAEGLSPRDIALYIRDAESYAPLVEGAAQRLGVQVSLSVPGPLLANGYLRALLTALKAIASPDIRGLGRLASSSYFPISSWAKTQFLDVLTDLCRDYDAWDKLGAWASNEDWAKGWLLPLLKYRSESLGARRTLVEWRDSLADLASSSTALESAAKEGPTKDRDTRAMGVMQGSLADLHYAQGPSPCTFRDFLNQAERLWRDQTVSYPERSSGIRLVSRVEQLGPFSAVAALGMLEGSIPRRRREDPVLFDQDREEIARLSGGSVRLPTSHDLSADERAHFVRLCASPSHRLLLSYPLTSDDSDRVVTLYLEELRRATGLPLPPIHHRVGDLTPPPELCRGHEVRLAEALAHPPSALPDINDWASEAGQGLAAHDPEAPLPLSAMRDALECPFRFQARHRLMWPGERSSRVFRVVDSVVEEAGLIRAEDPDAALRRASRVYDDCVSRAYPHIESWEAEVLFGAKDKLLQAWTSQCVGLAESLPIEVERRSATLEELGFSGTIKLGQVSAKLAFRVAAAGRAANARVYVLPNLWVPDDAGEIGPTKVDAFILPLIALGLLRGNKAPVILELKNLKGYSRLIYRDFRSSARLSGQGSKVQLTFPVAGTDAWSGMKERLVEVGSVLSKASTAARSGEHCSRCRFGELCRRSRDFGERVDPFDYEVPPKTGGEG